MVEFYRALPQLSHTLHMVEFYRSLPQLSYILWWNSTELYPVPQLRCSLHSRHKDGGTHVIRLSAVRRSFPQGDAETPHVRFGIKLPVVDALQRVPLEGPLACLLRLSYTQSEQLLAIRGISTAWYVSKLWWSTLKHTTCRATHLNKVPVTQSSTPITHTHTHTYTHYTNTHTFTQTYLHTPTHLFTSTPTYPHTYLQKKCVHTHTHTHIHSLTFTFTHTHTHTNTHTLLSNKTMLIKIPHHTNYWPAVYREGLWRKQLKIGPTKTNWTAYKCIKHPHFTDKNWSYQYQ